MTTDDSAKELAAGLADAVLAPLREVGTLLAREVDRLNAEVVQLRAELAVLDHAYTVHLQTLHDQRTS